MQDRKGYIDNQRLHYNQLLYKSMLQGIEQYTSRISWDFILTNTPRQTCWQVLSKGLKKTKHYL